MSIKYFPFDKQTFDEDRADLSHLLSDHTRFYGAMITDGLDNNIANCFEVSADGSYFLTVTPGIARALGLCCYNAETDTFELETSDIFYDRIDRVGFRFDKNARTVTKIVLKGTPSNNPEGAAPTNTNQIRDLIIGEIRVRRNSNGIQPTNLTDTRADTDLCGYFSGKINGISADSFYRQVNDLFNVYSQRDETTLQDLMTQLNAQLSDELTTEYSAYVASLATRPVSTTNGKIEQLRKLPGENQLAQSSFIRHRLNLVRDDSLVKIFSSSSYYFGNNYKKKFQLIVDDETKSFSLNNIPEGLAIECVYLGNNAGDIGFLSNLAPNVLTCYDETRILSTNKLTKFTVERLGDRLLVWLNSQQTIPLGYGILSVVYNPTNATFLINTSLDGDVKINNTIVEPISRNGSEIIVPTITNDINQNFQVGDSPVYLTADNVGDKIAWLDFPETTNIPDGFIIPLLNKYEKENFYSFSQSINFSGTDGRFFVRDGTSAYISTEISENSGGSNRVSNSVAANTPNTNLYKNELQYSAKNNCQLGFCVNQFVSSGDVLSTFGTTVGYYDWNFDKQISSSSFTTVIDNATSIKNLNVEKTVATVNSFKLLIKKDN